ncbi:MULTISPECIES: oligosaccharide flippase family protein [Moorena]|uniref:Membrane protein involved in the export of O-antigen and teichoic acid n=1 Tax=Moorena producens 3L TaxID=489825 RepID=F4XX16_9CYAN|nr:MULTISPECIES: oligosaccharide flippase family protein [Moorena]NES85912.1 oligosaccharide flippase family protein [Moorena sp. SIO2B7]EGJ30901.1 membrane protein involved in the export of O-antigen and teichoic acid [Moorena producens 3L]NEP30648.1 oligosaccharide flippase family protein [Moorena sp. SIO3B2]NEP64862.1 oligosaccharide flippase family protein [Moorena sp. SIO3A5]NER87475.1 oligosaccharide flippase family protein [Moorena sp. SIO3A2]
MSSSLKKQLLRGAIWTVAGYGTSQFLRLASNLVLTRLLAPEFFGLMALANVFIIGLRLFSDVGIGASIIQNKRGDDPVFLNTIWTIQVLRGLLLWVACLIITWPVAHFYNNPQLLWLMPVIGVIPLIEGFNSTAVWSLNRQMAFGKIMMFELVGQLSGLILMVTWAFVNRTIWALAIGNVLTALVKMVMSHWLIPGKSNRFTWEKEAANSIFSFGKWIFISTALTFLATQADRLILGKLFSFELLGIYGVAFNLAYLPSQVISAISSKVLLPTFSQLADLPRETFRIKIWYNRQLILVVAALMLTVSTAFGDVAIFILYDERFYEAAWMLPILTLGIWPALLIDTVQQALMALGKPNYNAYSQLVKSLKVCIGIPLGFYLMEKLGNGALGAVVVIAFNDILPYLVITYGLCREGLSFIKQDLWATALLLTLLMWVIWARYMLGFGYPISGLF